MSNVDRAGSYVIFGSVALACILIGISGWLDRRHTRRQQQATRPGLYLEGDPYAAVAAYEARHWDTEWWLHNPARDQS